MAVGDKEITSRYAIYNADCIDAMASMPDGKVHFSIYSPPFGGLYQYSSDDRDLSNSKDYAEFFEHYAFVVEQIRRVTMPGRLSAVHCMDIPTGNTGIDAYVDFPGDIIRLHQKNGFEYVARHVIWKEPLAVRNRTMAKNLAHRTITEDAAKAGVACADYLVVFRKKGANPVPITNPTGLMAYAGSENHPADLLKYRGWSGDQKENRYSHWIWRRYASSVWDDIRIGRVLPFRDAKDENDEKHVHPLQLDVIERAITLRSNPGETVLTPFMGVGSEVFGAVSLGRRGIGMELKPSYFEQARRNMANVDIPVPDQGSLDLDGEAFPE